MEVNQLNNQRKSINDAESWKWHTNFAGKPMQHNYYLYQVIDEIMEENLGISGIVEIGTGYGALSTVLGLWGIARNIPVFTVDIRNLHDERIFKSLKITYAQMDEFGQPLINEVKRFINKVNGPLLFICDGGDKIREFNLWAPLLRPGSVIAAHDWTTEIDYPSIETTVENYCEPYRSDKWNEMNVQFLTFKIRQTRPFLSIVTRNHPDRSKLLKRCTESVDRQRNKDFQHVVIYDKNGSGIPSANRLFFENRHLVTGEYVFILDDDDILITEDFVDDMKLVARENNYPDIIFILMNLCGTIYPTPLVWEKDKMIPGNIGSSCFIMRNELWQNSVDFFKTTETPGDFNFINAAFSNSHSVYWYGKTYCSAPSLGWGKSEDELLQ